MHRFGIIAVLLIILFLHLFRLEQEGLGNLYYAAGVKSMMLNWHNFFFLSFDPAGFISLDKPPLGFWIQTLLTKILGFEGWVLFLPQTLGGVVSAYILYIIIARYCGAAAGIIASLALAFTPIFVATSRNNTIDALLLTVLLMASNALLPAAEELNWKKLMLAFALLGIGFNIKSMQAFMVLPAFYSTYLLLVKGEMRRKIIHLFMATLLLVSVSMAWFLIVDSISPNERPYVGSSKTNSAIELATGYNGLGHFLGYGVQVPGREKISLPTTSDTFKRVGFFERETGLPDPLRLFNRQLGGQISWFLPFALTILAVSIYKFCFQKITEKYKTLLLFWGAWLIPQVVFFSIAEGMHRYYLIMMAPAIAGLVGLGYNILVGEASGYWKNPFLLVAPLIITISVQGTMLLQYPQWRGGLLVILGLGVCAICLFGWFYHRGEAYPVAYRRGVLFFAFLMLFCAPATWSLTPILYGTGYARPIPFAGPELDPDFNKPGVVGSSIGRLSSEEISFLVDYLLARHMEEKFIVAVPNAQIAAPIILATGKSVMTYGGFLGSEKILTTEKLEEMVAKEQVRYIMIGSVYSQQPEVDRWVRSHGIVISATEWRGAKRTNAVNVMLSSSERRGLQLYDCKIDRGNSRHK